MIYQRKIEIDISNRDRYEVRERVYIADTWNQWTDWILIAATHDFTIAVELLKR